MKKPRLQEIFAERVDVGPIQRPMTSTHQHERHGSDYQTELSDLKKDVAQFAKSVQDLKRKSGPKVSSFHKKREK